MRGQLSLFLGLFVGFFGVTAVAQVHGQTVPDVAADQYVYWSQPGPSLAAVRTYRYKIKVDSASAFTVVTPTCQAAASGVGFECGIQNPGPTPGNHTMSSTYALPLSGGGFSGDAPVATCAWNTIGDPTVPQSNFRWGRLLGGIISALKKFASWWT